MTPNWVHMQPPVFVPFFDPAQGAIVLTQVHDPGVIPAARSIAAVSGHPVYVQNHCVPPGMFAAPGGPGSIPIYDHEYWPQPLPQPRLQPRVPLHRTPPTVAQPRSSQPRVTSSMPQGQLASGLFFLRMLFACPPANYQLPWPELQQRCRHEDSMPRLADILLSAYASRCSAGSNALGMHIH